ncbi:hypothetical protein SOPP22_07330 [Shewanella sp. OPT22]|nr:hypothetical protein SOPP22_07330 [Shewanella sp. OPT22]
MTSLNLSLPISERPIVNVTESASNFDVWMTEEEASKAGFLAIKYYKDSSWEVPCKFKVMCSGKGCLIKGGVTLAQVS